MIICRDSLVVIVTVQIYHIWSQRDSTIQLLPLPSWTKKSSHGSTDGATCCPTSKGLPKEGSSFQSSNAHSNNLNTNWFLWALGNFFRRPGRRLPQTFYHCRGCKLEVAANPLSPYVFNAQDHPCRLPY